MDDSFRKDVSEVAARSKTTHVKSGNAGGINQMMNRVRCMIPQLMAVLMFLGCLEKESDKYWEGRDR